MNSSNINPIQTDPSVFQIEDYLNGKFKTLVTLIQSMPLESQQNLFEKMTSSLKAKLMIFHKNLQNITNSLKQTKNDLTKNFTELCKTLENVESYFKEKKMKFIEKLVEEESNRSEALKTNPNLVSFINNFSKMAKSKKFEKNQESKIPFKFCEEVKENKRDSNKPSPMPHKNTVKIKSLFEESKDLSLTQHERKQDLNDKEIELTITSSKLGFQENGELQNKEDIGQNNEENNQINSSNRENIEKKNSKVKYSKFIQRQCDIFFRLHVQKFKTLEEILRKFCPKVSIHKNFNCMKNHEEEEFTPEILANIKKEYEKKFASLLKYVEIHQKFPDFIEELDEELTDLRRKKKLLPVMQYIHQRHFFYERNLNYLSYCTISEDQKKLYELLLTYLDYQKEFLVLPKTAMYFNKYAGVVFAHLKNINNNGL